MDKLLQSIGINSKFVSWEHKHVAQEWASSCKKAGMKFGFSRKTVPNGLEVGVVAEGHAVGFSFVLTHWE